MGSEHEFGDEKTAATLPPFVEVEMVYQTGNAGMVNAARWQTFEVWTRNRIYCCDWTMKCVQVIDRLSDKAVDHELLGARLAGGQSQHDDALEITYPVPRPGNEAVFERPERKGYITTSTVLRVVLRVRVLTVPHDLGKQTWDEVTSTKKP
ncbi:MAG: hypothetical protein CMN30_04415 [Sandaracinus sp.]|nr:hypothetical protein [Sandaracinus sp.]